MSDTTAGEDLRQDAAEAFRRAQLYHRELEDIYDYFMPFRRPTVDRGSDSGGQSEGSGRTDLLFDGTAPSAAMTFAGSVHADWFPLNAPIWQLEAGPLVPPGDGAKMITEALQRIGMITSSIAQTPALYSQTQEMFVDLFAGTGAMFIDANAGSNSELVRGRAVPIMEIALEEGPWGDIEKIWWKRKYMAGMIPRMWPEGKISDALAKVIKDTPRTMIEVIQYTYYDAKEQRWCLKVWCEKDTDNHVIHTQHFARNPWIIPRYFKVPGEVFGRGLAHLGLPFVKTVNKAREYALTAAAFAVLGIFTRRNDAAFNPDTVRFEPGAMWTVGSNGGPMGPTISRLPIPQDFDISTVIVQDERAQIKQVLMDDELPDLDDRVRSPTEISGRMARHAKRYGGVNARIASEAISPFCQRIIDVGQKAGWLSANLLGGQKLPTNLTIDSLLVKMKIVAPAMASQNGERFDGAVKYLQVIGMLLGPQAPLLAARVKQLVPDMGRWCGLAEQYLPSEEEITAGLERMQQAASAQAQAEAAPPPEQPDPAAQYTNGGSF